MKAILQIIGVLTMLSLTAVAEPAAENGPDPIIGHWIWRGQHFVTVFPDGTAVSKKGPKATWTYLNNREAERKYRFIWDGGLFIDSITASRDGKTLDAKDQNGAKFIIRRAPNEKKAEPQ